MKLHYNNRQLTHLWANFHGVKNSGVRFQGSNLYFEDHLIYSYGAHFCAGGVYTKETPAYKMIKSEEKAAKGLKQGEVLFLISSRSYSNTTAKHLSYIRSAVSTSNGEFCFYVPNPANPESSENTEHLFNNVLDALFDCLTCDARTVRAGTFLDIDTQWIKYSEFMGVIGKKPEVIPSDLMNQAEVIWRESFKRREELHAKHNTPEEIAKREKAKARKLEREATKNAERAAQAEREFIEQGKNIPSELRAFIKAGTDLIRVSGEEVVTSRGARVPLEDAVKLLRAIKAGLVKEGDTVGAFTFRQLTTGGAAVIGCHVVFIDHAESVLKEYL
jgi:hypothetical protein